MSEGGRLWAVGSVDLEFEVSLVKEMRAVNRHACENLERHLEVEIPQETRDREACCSKVNLHQW